MAGPKAFVGVSGKARQVKNIYVGVSGKARKVKRAYVGVGGKARLFYSSDWWLPIGVASSSCLGAYRFKGVASQTVAKTDLSGHGYTLTISGPSWSSANGFWIDPAVGEGSYPYNCMIYNNTLAAAAIKSIVIRYSFTSYGEYQIVGSGGSDGYALLWLGGGSNDDTWPGTSSMGTHNPFILKDGSGNVLWTRTKQSLSATIGMTVKTAIYLNGNAYTTESFHASKYPAQSSGIYMMDLPRHNNNKYLAAAFYSVALTAAQHKEIANAMNEF